MIKVKIIYKKNITKVKINQNNKCKIRINNRKNYNI